MYIIEEEFSDRPILEWLIPKLIEFHIAKYGEECEVIRESNSKD